MNKIEKQKYIKEKEKSIILDERYGRTEQVCGCGCIYVCVCVRREAKPFRNILYFILYEVVSNKVTFVFFFFARKHNYRTISYSSNKITITTRANPNRKTLKEMKTTKNSKSTKVK